MILHFYKKSFIYVYLRKKGNAKKNHWKNWMNGRITKLPVACKKGTIEHEWSEQGEIGQYNASH